VFVFWKKKFWVQNVRFPSQILEHFVCLIVLVPVLIFVFEAKKSMSIIIFLGKPREMVTLVDFVIFSIQLAGYEA